jgi:hypothetical protein
MKVFLAILCLVTCAQALDYKRDVMPIFKAKCYDCHSEEGDKIKGGLRLDDEEHFLKRFSKNEVVVPGDWDASYLFVTLVRPQHEKGAMPPKNKGERLTEEEIMTVAQWIHEGAKIDGKKGKERTGQVGSQEAPQVQRGSYCHGAIRTRSGCGGALPGESGRMPRGSKSLLVFMGFPKGR